MRLHHRLLIGLALLAACCLPGAAQDEKTSVADLIKSIDDPDKSHQTRRDAIIALAAHGRKAAPAEPVLRKILAGPAGKTDLRPPAATTLGAIGKPAVPALAEALSITDPLVRTAVLDALAAVGPDARDAVPALLKWIDADLARPDGAVDNRVLVVLGKVCPDVQDIVPRAVKIIQVIPDHPPKRKARGDKLQAAETVTELLGEYGPAAKDAVPVLLRVLKMEEGTRLYTELLKKTAATLGEMGPDAADALPALRALLDTTTGAAQPAEKAITRIKAPRPVPPAERVVWHSEGRTVSWMKGREWELADDGEWELRERFRRDDYIELLVVDGPDRIGETIRLYDNRSERRAKGGVDWEKAHDGSWAGK